VSGRGGSSTGDGREDVIGETPRPAWQPCVLIHVGLACSARRRTMPLPGFSERALCFPGGSRYLEAQGCCRRCRVDGDQE
jgi:hypothetical protein